MMIPDTRRQGWRSTLGVFLVFLRLGLTSFGGPVAHLGYFEQEFVARRGWVTPEIFGELVALAQALPGPASSEVGFAIGLRRGGVWGGVAAWSGFTLPSAVLMVSAAVAGEHMAGLRWQGALVGLRLVAVAVVAQAVWSMQRRLAPDAARLVMALVAAGIVLGVEGPWGTPLAITVGALVGLLILRGERSSATPTPDGEWRASRRTGAWAAALLLALVVGCVVSLRSVGAATGTRVFWTFCRAGALVFGGGHVVLPVLQGMVVDRHWVAESTFLQGYGLAQALPGPLFAFAAYLGASMGIGQGRLLLAFAALAGIFLPGLLAMSAVLPVWHLLHGNASFRHALGGVHAAVVGVLAAALYRPLWVTAIRGWADFSIAAAMLAGLIRWRVPPWALVLLAGGIGAFRAM